MGLIDAEKATIDNKTLQITTPILKTIKYFFIPDRKIVCPKCGAENDIKIEPIKNNTSFAICYCNKCDFKKEIRVEYLDAKVNSDIKAGKI